MTPKEKNNFTGITAKARWILPLTLWVVLSCFSYPFLLKVEERSFFEFDMAWFIEFLDKPSGLLSWLSLFFIQFFHIPWLGALIWILLLTAAAELTRIMFRIPQSCSALAYIPAAILVTYNMSLGYMIYYVNLPGFFLLPTLGYLWVLLTVAVFRKVSNTATVIILSAVWGIAGYYIAGFYGLIGVLTAAVDTAVSQRSKTFRLSALISVIAVTLLSPILFVETTAYYLPSGWTVGLPDYMIRVSLTRIQAPVIAAMLLLVSAPLIQLPKLSFVNKTPSYVQGILLIAIVSLSYTWWYKDPNYMAELKMIHAADNLEWEEAINTFRDISEKSEKDKSWQPTRIMVVLKDLALIKTGQEGDQTFAFDDGCKQQNTICGVSMSMQIGWIMGLHYGIPGLCQRWCYEENMLFGWSNVSYRYNIMTAMVFGNRELTEKYLNKLDHTLFYRKWSREQRALLNDRELLARTAPYDQILPLLCYDDMVTSDLAGLEMFLNRHFNGPSPMESTPLYDRIALLFAMKSKNSTMFWTRFFLYLESNNPKKIDRYYQEAAYLYANNGQKDLLDAFPIDDRVKDTYKSFMQYASKYGKLSLEDARNCFPKHLRETFFYYYYYVNELILF